MEYTIRPVRASDAEGINLLRRMPGVFENILGFPSERIKRNEDYLLGLGENVHQFSAIAEVNGQEVLIGAASLVVRTNPRQRHIGDVGIMVHRDYQGHGVGRALMNQLLDLADNWLMLVRVELTVFHDNERAIELYKSVGFELEGRIRMGAIRSGQYVDELLMSRIRR